MSMRDLVPWRRRQGLTRPTSESPFLSIQQEMNRLFDDFFSDSLPAVFQSEEMGQVAVSPKVNVEETESEIHVTAELPGMDEKDVDVSLHNGSLVIRGEKKFESKSDDNTTKIYSSRLCGNTPGPPPLVVSFYTNRIERTAQDGP